MKKILDSTFIVLLCFVCFFGFSACGDNWKEKYSFKSFSLDDVLSIEIAEYKQAMGTIGFTGEIVRSVTIVDAETIELFFEQTYEMQPVEKTGDRSAELYRYSFRYSLKNGTSKSFRFNNDQTAYVFLGKTGKIPYKHYLAEFSAEMTAKAVQLLYAGS